MARRPSSIDPLGATGPGTSSVATPAPIASTVEHNAFREKGAQLARYLRNPEEAGQHQNSDFDSFTLLATWGWVDQNRTTSEEDRQEYYGNVENVGNIVKETHDVDVRWKNERAPSTVSQSHQYRATDAFYHNVYWPEHGVIVTIKNESPASRIHDKKYPSNREDGLLVWYGYNKAPELKHWSDVVFLTYKNLARKIDSDPCNLKYVYQRYIRNTETLKVLGYVLRERYPMYQAKWKAQKWPDREVIKRNEHGFHAMLATPNVRGVAWLLIQHRRVFPGKTIRNITVYCETDSLGYSPTLRIEIG